MKSKEIYICNLCKKKNYGEIGSFHYVGKDLRTYCKNCSKNIENMTNLPEVMVIPISPLSFDFVKKNKIYFHPSSYSRKGGKYIAFYISQPVSAITHIAEVENILKNQNPQQYLKDINFDKEVKSIKIYLLKNLKKLKNEIIRGKSPPIQGNQNTTLNKINSSKNLKELFGK